jgi:hypothetical protein
VRVVKTAFLIFMAVPGSFALIAIVIREAVKMARGWREDDEDEARALRIAREYDIPEWAVELSEPVTLPKRRERDAPTSVYTKGMN